MDSVLLDPSVFLVYFLNDQKKEESRKLVVSLSQGELSAVISPLCIMEVKYHLIKTIGHDKAEAACFFIRNCPNLRTVELNNLIAERAADLCAKYHDRENRPISFAEAIHLATAIEAGCKKVISADSDFRKISEIKTEVY